MDASQKPNMHLVERTSQKSSPEEKPTEISPVPSPKINIALRQSVVLRARLCAKRCRASAWWMETAQGSSRPR